MITERPAPIESAENYRKRLAIKASAIGSAALLALGLAGPKTVEAGAQQTPEQQMIIAGIEDEALSDNLEDSINVVEKLDKAGFNTLKVTMPWTFPTQGAEINSDLLRYQNAIRAAKQFKMDFAVTMVPYSPKTGVGQAPDTASQMRRFCDTAVSYLHAFEEIYPGGHFIIGIGNEVNSKTFWRPQDDEAPRKVVKLMSICYPLLKAEAAELGVDITVVGGELASNHKPYEFIEAMGKAKKELKIKGPIMDVFALHPYGKTNDEAPDVKHVDGSSAGHADYEQITEAVAQSFGRKIPVWYTEYGAKTRIPADKTNQYLLPPQKMSTLINEAEQEMFYTQALKMAFCQKAGAVMLFNVIDGQDDTWTSGIYRPRPDYEPKSSYEGTVATINQLETGEVVCNDEY